MTDTPETDSWCGWGVGGLEVVPASCARKLERERDAAIAERDEARSRFNEIDLCQNGQSPCKWSLKLIDERDTAIAERDEAQQQRDRLENGNYFNKCAACDTDFIGHKCPWVCKKCRMKDDARWEALSEDEKKAEMEKMSADFEAWFHSGTNDEIYP